MMETLATKVIIAGIVLLLLILINGKRILQYKALIVLFFAVYFADNLLIILTNAYPATQLIPSHTWEDFLVCNWSGKLYSILFTLALLYFTRRWLSFKECGLTLHQEEDSVLPCTIVILALAGWAALVGVSSPKGDFNIPTLIYLAFIPAFNEELVYRGYLLGCLDKIMPGRLNLLGGRIGWGAVVTSLMFGLLHGLWLNSDFSVHIDVIALRNSFISGFIFAWLRERSGSLLMPVIAHSVENLLFFLPRMI